MINKELYLPHPAFEGICPMTSRVRGGQPLDSGSRRLNEPPRFRCVVAFFPFTSQMMVDSWRLRGSDNLSWQESRKKALHQTDSGNSRAGAKGKAQLSRIHYPSPQSQRSGPPFSRQHWGWTLSLSLQVDISLCPSNLAVSAAFKSSC